MDFQHLERRPPRTHARWAQLTAMRVVQRRRPDKRRSVTSTLLYPWIISISSPASSISLTTSSPPTNSPLMMSCGKVGHSLSSLSSAEGQGS